MNGLIHSRKFWLACFAVVQTVVLHYVDVPRDIWVSIDALVVVLISGIAIEDAAENRAGITK
jgi:hypothetical protein